jgi:hypothetical protein
MIRKCLFMLFVLHSLRGHGLAQGSLFYVPKARQLNVGLDLSQFSYLLDQKKKELNVGIFAQYKPYYLLGFNTSLIYNHVRSPRSNGYKNLEDYHSRGTCLKLGFDLSIRLSRRKRDTRGFIGYQACLVGYKESGRFEIDNYWGKYTSDFETRWRTGYAGEVIFGFQFLKGRWLLRPQVYIVFDNNDRRISRNDAVLNGYSSPFVPGFGYRRGGLNFILVCKLKQYRK